jgi:TonB family protein
MQQEPKKTHGLGLSQRGHAIFVGVYSALVLAFAAFGLGRFIDMLPYFGISHFASFHHPAISPASQAAFVEAMRTNAPDPRPDPSIPHRINFYPLIAQRFSQQGDVDVKLWVLADGTIGNVQVVRSSGYTQLDAAAVIGVGGWRYIPAARNHKPVASWTTVRVRFRI